MKLNQTENFSPEYLPSARIDEDARVCYNDSHVY